MRTGDLGYFLTTKFFGMKANKYLHDHDISQRTLAKVAAKAFRNGAINPNAFRRQPLTEEQILESPVLNYPLTQFMFCAPDEGAAAMVVCRADIAHKFTDKPVYIRASEIRTRRIGAYEVHSTFAPVEEDVSPTVYAARAAFEAAGREEQADKEDYELEILEGFMPEQLSEDELDEIVDDVIAEVGATSLRDIGRVMADVMPQISGRADGSAVSQIVREKLA